MRIGIIALTDCSSIVMAHELGLFKKYGIESTVSKEASWAVIRDRLTLGENQATHMLLGMPYASTMGLLGSPKKPMIIPMYLNRNGQAITLTKALLDKGVEDARSSSSRWSMEAKAKGDADDLRDDVSRRARTRCGCATGSPPAASIPTRTSRSSPSRPPQMVANMKVGKMDGFCVGEPWNARAIADGIGFTAITTQQMWKDHPEKVLAFTEEFADQEPEDGQGGACGRCIEASQWLDKLENRPQHGRGRLAAAVHQLPPRRSSSAACSATTTTATAARRRTSTT